MEGGHNQVICRTIFGIFLEIIAFFLSQSIPTEAATDCWNYTRRAEYTSFDPILASVTVPEILLENETGQ